MKHNSIDNLKIIKSEVELINKDTKIIAVSKTFPVETINPLIDFGHTHFGENKVQEAIEKWTTVKKENSKIRLHMIGKLQSNKVKLAVNIFDYIHSVDSEKLAKKISDESSKIDKKIKIFIQVNIGEEIQKSGVEKNNLEKLISCCKDLKLDLVGLMCIPPINTDPIKYFRDMQKLTYNHGFSELSMGMSSDYIQAVENSATFIRIGSAIFGARS